MKDEPAVFRVSIAEIKVDRAIRQRKEIGEDVSELAESLKRDGLINPILITREKQLIAGERRLEAAKSLGWDHILVMYREDLSDAQMMRLEWAENVHRRELPWQDRVTAAFKYFTVRRAEEPRTTPKLTARELGLSNRHLNFMLLVHRKMLVDPRIFECTSLHQARNALGRAFGRQFVAELSEFGGEVQPSDFVEGSVFGDVGEFGTDVDPFGEDPPDERQHPVEPNRPQVEKLPVLKSTGTGATVTNFDLIHGDFAEWAEAYTGPAFNVLHLDFPYGVNFTNTGAFSKANKLDTFYQDDPEVYLKLLGVLWTHWDKLVAPSAHIIHWVSMTAADLTKDWYRDLATGRNIRIDIDPRYLIWHKNDNRGMLHNADYGLRHVYEAALLVNIGRQRLARSTSNVIAHPTTPDKHPSAKPLAVVRHYLSCVVDTTTRLLDPTCGHGSAVATAIRLGARNALGIDKDEQHINRARIECQAALADVVAKVAR